jgi:hypothetical protein
MRLGGVLALKNGGRAVEKIIAFSSPFHAEMGYAVLAMRRWHKWTHRKH